MARAKLSVRSGLLVVSLMWTATLSRGDTEVSCVFLGSCVLPCRFQAASEEVIHWIYQTGGDTPVHSYYDGQDIVSHQQQQFKGRTSLFHGRIPGGDASLQLSGVTLQDAGRYKCYASTTKGNQESFVILKVKAPVHKIDIQLIKDSINCTSRGIYPEPKLTWSTEPPSSQTLLNSTVVERNDQGLYHISSTLMGVANDTQVVYNCSISSHSSSRSATMRQLSPVLASSKSDVSIPCRDSDSVLRDFNLSWTFNHEDHILSYISSRAQRQVHGKWKDRVGDVSDEGSLELRASTAGGHQEGTYTCEITVAGATYVTNTYLEIQNSQTGDQNYTGVIIGVIVVACIVIAGIIIFLKRRGTKSRSKVTTDEGDCLRDVKEI